MADGRIQLPAPDDFIELLRPEVCPNLECVYLNGCDTLNPLGNAIQAELPHLTIIAWDSKAADKAAIAFSHGFYDALAEGTKTVVGTGQPAGPATYSDAFDSAKRAMEAAGFMPGDPTDRSMGAQAHGLPAILISYRSRVMQFARQLSRSRSNSRKDLLAPEASHEGSLGS